ncbi:MAG: hypothetical protein ACO35C_04965 [Pontimonas sp.]
MIPKSVTILLVVTAVLVAMSIAYSRQRRRVSKRRCLDEIRATIKTIESQMDMDRQSSRVLADLEARLKKLDPPEAVFHLAQTLKRGVYPFYRPDPDAADKACRALVLSGCRDDLRTEAMTLLYEDGPASLDCAGVPFPDSLFLETMARYRRHAPRHETPVCVRQHTPPRRRRPEPTIVPVPADPQNSHQHSVVATSRNALSGLAACDDATIVSQVEDFIASGCSPLLMEETRSKALHALDSIDNTHVHQFDMSERQALARVWNEPGVDRDTVVQQLASAIEHGLPVCHTGKMTRLASCLDTGDDTRVLGTAETKQILYTMASRIRDSILERAAPSERDDYEHNDDSTLKQRMVDEFDRESGDFVQSNGLSPAVMHPVLDEIRRAL